jgi:6-phosphogluconolactonase
MCSSNNNISKQLVRSHSYGTTTALEQAAMQAILHAAQQSVRQRGAFYIALAGGTTPRNIYELLRNAETDWTAWHIYFGDERCLPPDDAERNSHMAALAWLDKVAIPSSQIHPIPAENGAEIAASSYAETVRAIELFDLVLLGLGEDGHTASLFPNHDWGTTPDSPAALPVHNAPKPPPDRVSLSAQRLSAARQVMFLVTGETKLKAVNSWRNGVSIPAAAIIPKCGVDVYLEARLL